MVLIEQESLGFVTADEEQALVEAARGRFSTPRLQEHLVRRLSGNDPPQKSITATAEVAAYHETTVWSTFQGS
eukprot:1442734-Prymnesium_polylepis.1